VILLCDAVVDWDVTEMVVYLASPFDFEEVMTFWTLVERDDYREINHRYRLPIPDGTVFCDRIRRLRECDVDWDNEY